MGNVEDEGRGDLEPGFGQGGRWGRPGEQERKSAQARCRRYQKKISRLKRRVLLLKERARAREEGGVQRPLNPEPIQEEIPGPRVFRGLGLEISPAVITRALLLKADSREKAERIFRSSRTLVNTVGHLRATRRRSALELMQRDFPRYRRVFGKKSAIAAHMPFLAEVFGESVLRKVSDKVVLYVNHWLDFADATVLCAHVDGSFLGDGGRWRQIFELRLVLRRAGRQTKVTFAFGLLAGTSQEHYEAFFQAVRNHACPRFEVLIADFEVAIANAAEKVWPHVRIRGCYFHFVHNLWSRQSRIRRTYGKAPTTPTQNFLALLPFLRFPAAYLLAAVRRLRFAGQLLLQNTDFKLLMYVYQTYVKKLRCLFLQDMQTLVVRTNNACEGSNSGFSKAFFSRPAPDRIADFVVVRFKRDVVKPWVRIPAEDTFDAFLQLLQQRADQNLTSVLGFCYGCAPPRRAAGESLLAALSARRFGKARRIGDEDELEARAQLDDLARRLRAFKAEKRAAMTQFRAQFLAGVTSGPRPRVQTLVEGQIAALFRDTDSETDHENEDEAEERELREKLGTEDFPADPPARKRSGSALRPTAPLRAPTPQAPSSPEPQHEDSVRTGHN